MGSRGATNCLAANHAFFRQQLPDAGSKRLGRSLQTNPGLKDVPVRVGVRRGPAAR